MGFKKGQSGNPGGRPKLPRSVVELAREHSDDAMNVLIEIMTDPKASVSSRVSAAQVVLDRGWGKAAQTVNLNTNPLENLDDEQQRTLLEALELIAGPEISNDSGPPKKPH